jgi:hypothetical protein
LVCGSLLRLSSEKSVLKQKQLKRRLSRTGLKRRIMLVTLFLRIKLEREDWEIIAHCVALLEPLWLATMELQGNPGDGFAAGLMNVQWDIERILEHLTQAYDT